jgi:hypothetical protein
VSAKGSHICFRLQELAPQFLLIINFFSTNLMPKSKKDQFRQPPNSNRQNSETLFSLESG